MLVYPQLGSGALSQFPAQRRRQARTVVNRAADGRLVKLADPAGAITEWTLPYAGLTDDEAAALRTFFEDAEGTLNGFTFLDPLGNLLAWSDGLDQEVWQRGPQLTVAGAAGDWQLTNGGAAAQALTQTLSAPGDYLYCLSANLRAAAGATVTLLVGSARSDRVVGAGWQRVVFAARGEAGAASVRFGIEVPAGATVEVSEAQVEPCGAASVYQASTAGGIYENAHLSDDAFGITTTGENQHSATVKIIHGNHL